MNPRDVGVPSPGPSGPDGPGGPGLLIWAGKLGGGLRLGNGFLSGGPLFLLSSSQ